MADSSSSGCDLPSDPTGRYAADTVGFSHQHQAEIYDRIDQAGLLRQQQLVKAQSLQDLIMCYGGRLDSDPHASSMIRAGSNPGYGVSLPPGRHYSSGKGLHANAAMELDYPGNVLSRGGNNNDHRASYLREFELIREEERHRDREREKEGERLREQEQEREKEGERLRERERVRKRALETKHRHHHHSPVKEKRRREYICKVYPSCLVDIERDCLSLDKQYPRLFVTPEFSKAVVNWPKGNLKLSIHTPVSFEHDFVEEESATSNKLLVGQPPNSEQGNTVWNAKIVLMSGLSRTALEELSSDKIVDDRVPHICNFLRFAVLKKDHAFTAVGGPWQPADGGDPSVDHNSLIRTALRYAKDGIQLDLQNCQHWNRFLEIHYDRIGKDGFFSHKEITVLYVPNLSDCLPSLGQWCNQWLAHKKAVAERERQISLKIEKSREPKSKSSKQVKEKRKSDEPPRHPGLILQTKSTKDSKLRSLSLSLDSLLDYTDKDVEDSTLELSLFAESFYEMLQFQMGCRILTFLQKLRIKFVIKRTQRKRQREDGDEKDNAMKSPAKRPKGDDPPVKSESTNKKEEEDVKMEEATDEEEDPKEDPEEYEEVENGGAQHDSSTDKNVKQEANANVESENITSNEKAADETSEGETKVKESKSDAHVKEEKDGKVDKSKKETPVVKEAAVNRELLQAFRFFDRNRAGYIRVEDMRLIIHNLGMFLSHRDVKELVRSALLESNTGRDDRILYNKLVRNCG